MGYDAERCLLVGQIVNVSADESILGSDGKIDVGLLSPITFDPVHNKYLPLGGLSPTPSGPGSPSGTRADTRFML